MMLILFYTSDEEYQVTVGQNTQQRTVADKYSTKEIMTRRFFNISGKISNENSPSNNIGLSKYISTNEIENCRALNIKITNKSRSSAAVQPKYG